MEETSQCGGDKMEKPCTCYGGHIWIDFKFYLCLDCGGRGFIIFCPDCGRAGIKWEGGKRTCVECGKEV